MTRTTASRARGAGKLQLVVALGVTAALFLSAWRIIPVYIKSYAFEDTMREKAKFAQVERKPLEIIRQELHKRAQELELPVAREQIQVTEHGRGVRITVRYEVPVDLVVTEIKLQFDYTTDTGSAI